MASNKAYLEFVLDQLSETEGISWRAMMGEYVLYANGVVFGGIYDDRFLVKSTPAAKALMPDAPEELPYAGGKPMLLVERVEEKAFLQQLVSAMLPYLVKPKKRS